MEKGLKVQLKLQMFDRCYPITILSFIPAFHVACDTNCIYEGAAMWPFHLFIKKPVVAALRAITGFTSSRRSREEGKLTSYFQLVNYLFNTYEVDDTIAKAYADIINYKQTKDPNGVLNSQLL